MTLSNKRRAFVEEYLKDFNAHQAAVRAGYAARSARQMGSRLLSKVDIQNTIKERLTEKAMGADEVLTRLADMARGDMGDFLDIGSMTWSIDLQTAREKGLTKLIKKVKERTVITSNKDGEETETHTFEIELYDAQAALVQLGRHHKLFTENYELTGPNGKPLSGMSDADLLAAIQAAVGEIIGPAAGGEAP